MRLRALALAAALVLPASPAFAATGPTTIATDPCGDSARPGHDLARVDLHYSAKSFQVRIENCDDNSLYSPANGFVLEVHLVSLGGARLRGVMNEALKLPEWSGFSMCTTTCTPIKSSPYISYSATGYGGWADVLPGVTIPDSIEWYATLETDGTDDRAPDAGSATSNVMPVARASYVTIDPIPSQRYSVYGNTFVARGDLRYDSATGPRLFRAVTARSAADGSWIDPQGPGQCLRDPCPAWTTAFGVSRNTTVAASFDGDGFVAPSNRPTRKVLVSALVSLDLPATKTVRRGSTVIFRGVIRPKAPGTPVTLQVRNGPVGSPWVNYHTEDTYTEVDTGYYIDWKPTVKGTPTFRVVWNSGTTADGGVTNGISSYTTITVV